MTIRKTAASVAFCLFLAAQCWQTAAQETANAEIRIETELVQVPVMVSDAAGRPIFGLKVEDFDVFEDGKRQKIVSFSTEQDPIEVVLLIDTSGSTKSELETIRKAAESFISSLKDSDQAAIVAFRPISGAGDSNAEAVLLSAFTSQREKLLSALSSLESSFGTPLYDALIASAKLFNPVSQTNLRGRRAIVVLTDGVDSVSRSDYESARRAIQMTGAATYFVRLDTREFFESGLLGECSAATHFSKSQIRRYYDSLGSSRVERTSNFCQLGDFERLAISKRLYEIADAEMASLSRETGGKVFPAGNLAAARAGLIAAAAEASLRYSLGYYPTSDRRDGSYRKISVRVRTLPPGGKIIAREGYFAPGGKP